MQVFLVISGCGLLFLSRFFVALCTEPKCSRSTKVRLIRSRMHRIVAERRRAALQKRAA